MELIENAFLINTFSKALFAPHEYVTYTFDPVTITNHDMIFNEGYNYNDARFLLQLSLMVTNSNFSGAKLDIPKNFETTALSYGKCPVQLLNIRPDLNKDVNLAYILYNKDKNILLIIFSGTSNICTAGIDIDYNQIEVTGILNYESGMKVHKGIYSGYMSIRTQLIEVIKRYLSNNPKIIITGHSLGGAISILCTLDLAFYQPINYAFASPLIFNPKSSEVFKNLVKNSYRIVNLSDLVTLSPLPIMPNGDCFSHVGALVTFQKNMCNYPDNHSMAYMLEYNIPYIKLQ